MTRLFRRWIAYAVLSVSMVAATVGACYGEDKVVTVTAKHNSDVAWRPGT
ncbi:hypothetical protein J6500_14730 [Bradyrhizobium sp. WSM 1704]|nr:hypothetical protein [Bradyrhizobium semiaridum]MCA6123141.1 hypothetical protein [Bradyrhizobium semiaridum]